MRFIKINNTRFVVTVVETKINKNMEKSNGFNRKNLLKLLTSVSLHNTRQF